MQNAIVASASEIKVEIVENILDNTYTITISDNGEGFDPENFYLTKKIEGKGIGLLLAKQTAKNAGGSLTLKSEKNQGSVLQISCEHNHPSRPVLGDIAGVVVLTALSNLDIRIIYKHTTHIGSYCFDTLIINQIADGLWFSNLKMIEFLKALISENLQAISASE